MGSQVGVWAHRWACVRVRLVRVGLDRAVIVAARSHEVRAGVRPTVPVVLRHAVVVVVDVGDVVQAVAVGVRVASVARAVGVRVGLARVRRGRAIVASVAPTVRVRVALGVRRAGIGVAVGRRIRGVVAVVRLAAHAVAVRVVERVQRARVAGVPRGVVIRIVLRRVGLVRAVVAGVLDPISVGVEQGRPAGRFTVVAQAVADFEGPRVDVRVRAACPVSCSALLVVCVNMLPTSHVYSGRFDVSVTI